MALFRLFNIGEITTATERKAEVNFEKSENLFSMPDWGV